jgi:hypothetical protein
VDGKKVISQEMSDWEWFSVHSLTTFREHIVRDDGSIALTTYDTATTKRTTDDFSVHIYPSLSSECTPSLTGASEMQPLPGTGGDTQWGRFSDTDMTFGGGYPNALCRPPMTNSPKCSKNKEPFIFCDDGSRTYALCSEKDGKTVVICLSQMTDDPAMAEEIFSTFRWTE